MAISVHAKLTPQNERRWSEMLHYFEKQGLDFNYGRVNANTVLNAIITEIYDLYVKDETTRTFKQQHRLINSLLQKDPEEARLYKKMNQVDQSLSRLMYLEMLNRYDLAPQGDSNNQLESLYEPGSRAYDLYRILGARVKKDADLNYNLAKKRGKTKEGG